MKNSGFEKNSNKTQWNVNALVLMFCSLMAVSARAEEVYEAYDDAGVAEVADSDSDREVVVLRKKPTRRARPSAGDDGVNVNVNVDTDADSNSVSSAKSVADADATADSIASRAALVKKTRVREEFQNNDLLQERLESLRLKDEKRRTNNLMNSDALSDSEADLVRRERSRVVVSEVEVPEADDSVYVVKRGRTSTTIKQEEYEGEAGTRIGIAPRFGFANIGKDLYYEVSTKFLAGMNLLIETGDVFGFELGYSYGEYGVKMASSNPLVNYAQFYSRSGDETVELHQNLLELGMRGYLLPQRSIVRPFLTGGGAYSKNYVNYNDRVLSYLDNSGLGNIFGTDYESSAYMGTVGAGLDIGLSKSISLGLGFKYYHVFQFDDNSRLYYPSMYYGGSGAPNISEVEKAAAGSALGNNNFYTVTGGITFYF